MLFHMKSACFHVAVLHDLDLVKMQTTAWIRFKVEVEDEMGTSLKLIWLIRHSVVG